MFVFVLSKDGKPIMPTNPCKARMLLKDGKAKIVHRLPFTIKLLYESMAYTQCVVAGMDTGSKTVGCAAIANGNVLYQSEVTLRNDISGKMEQRNMYRRVRRSRKIRYRECRFGNRYHSKRVGRLAPSLKSKVESHLREKRFVESILPVSKWKVELASFDIYKITNPEVNDKEYQEGNQKGYYNVRAYVLARDNYTCQHCKGKSKDRKLHCHHIVWRSNNGTNTPANLICLCETCHDALHNGGFKLSGRGAKTKHATEIGVIKSQLKKSNWEFTETFGYETKYKREQCLDLAKTHANDAIAICCEDNQNVKLNNVIYLKKHVSHGDYQQRKDR
jgi:5-methylcytosine-specific restriction endonuclease McrA